MIRKGREHEFKTRRTYMNISLEHTPVHRERFVTNAGWEGRNHIDITPKDSLSIISQSRNKILGRSCSFTSGTRRGVDPIQQRHINLHLAAVDKRERLRQRQGSSILPQRISQEGVDGANPISLGRGKTQFQENRSKMHPKTYSNTFHSKLASRSFEHYTSGPRFPRGESAEDSFYRVKEDIEVRRRTEAEVDRALQQLMQNETYFETIYGDQYRAGKHQQIISNIPPGLNLPSNPAAVTGRFNNPEEDKKGDTLVQQQLPELSPQQRAAHPEFSSVQEITISVVDPDKTQETQSSTFYCCKKAKCRLL